MSCLLRCFLAGLTCVLLGGIAAARDDVPARSGATTTSADETATVAFQFDSPTTILSAQDMDRNGLLFPDGTLWFLRQEGRDPYYISAAGGRLSQSARLPAGSYAFAGTLESFHPAQSRNGLPVWSLTTGRQQPSPDGADFDRDYAGGGPTYALALPDSASADEVCGRAAGSMARRSVLLQIYHGEYHLFAPRGLPAHGGSGMAISCDGGATFEKIGQILAPQVSREEFLAAQALAVHADVGLWADGAMVEADARGERDCGTPPCDDKREWYYYLVFTDHNAPAERYTGLSIARVRVQDLMRAVRQRRAPAFRKYYNPSGALTLEGDYFTESGIGGRSTPVLVTPGQYMNTPGVVYDEYLKKYLLFYQANQKRVELRTSKNLMAWSVPVVAFQLDSASDRRVFYPSAAGDGPDPEVLDQTFYLYFLVRERPEGRWVNPQLLREKVSVKR